MLGSTKLRPFPLWSCQIIFEIVLSEHSLHSGWRTCVSGSTKLTIFGYSKLGVWGLWPPMLSCFLFLPGLWASSYPQSSREAVWLALLKSQLSVWGSMPMDQDGAGRWGFPWSVLLCFLLASFEELLLPLLYRPLSCKDTKRLISCYNNIHHLPLHLAKLFFYLSDNRSPCRVTSSPWTGRSLAQPLTSEFALSNYYYCHW